MAHGERKAAEEATAEEAAENEENDSTIILSDEESEQFVTVTKRKKRLKKQLCIMRDEDHQQLKSRGLHGTPGKHYSRHSVVYWRCRNCNRRYYYFPHTGGSREYSGTENTSWELWNTQYLRGEVPLEVPECPGDRIPD